MLTKEDRQKHINNLQEWREIIFSKQKTSIDFSTNEKGIKEMASYMASKAVEKTNLTSRAKGS